MNENSQLKKLFKQSEVLLITTQTENRRVESVRGKRGKTLLLLLIFALVK